MTAALWKNAGQETIERTENWKDQVAAKHKHQVAQLKTLRINNNKLNTEIYENRS